MVRWGEADLRLRLRWLLVFRAAAATVLLGYTIVGDALLWAASEQAAPLYAVCGGTYFVVFLLGLALRSPVQPLVVAAVHLAAAVFASAVVVLVTGSAKSPFTFFYLLAILDGALVGGRAVALAVASACSIAYGMALVATEYGWLGELTGREPSSGHVSSFVAHVTSFYAVAFLAGHLAEQLRRAQRRASSVELDLEQLAHLHAVVVESLPLGVVTYDAELVVQSANASALGLLEPLAEGVVGHPLAEPLAALVRGREALTEIELEVGGTTRVWSVARAPLLPRPEHAEVRSAIETMVIEDRTEMRGLERTLAAKERLASIGQLAAAIAHELRNPLASISGAVELMCADPKNDAYRERMQIIIVREVERLNTMVHDFLLYARPTRPERIMSDAAAVGRDVATLIAQDARWQARKVEVDVGTQPFAEVDPAQLRQVLWNLLRNALEASPLDTAVRLVFTEAAGQLVLEVHDEGPGVSPKLKGHLFEPFQTTKSDGSGLGLAVVHRIVEAHGGSIELLPRSPRGTVARVVLPRQASVR